MSGIDPKLLFPSSSKRRSLNPRRPSVSAKRVKPPGASTSKATPKMTKRARRSCDVCTKSHQNGDNDCKDSKAKVDGPEGQPRKTPRRGRSSKGQIKVDDDNTTVNKSQIDKIQEGAITPEVKASEGRCRSKKAKNEQDISAENKADKGGSRNINAELMAKNQQGEITEEFKVNEGRPPSQKTKNQQDISAESKANEGQSQSKKAEIEANPKKVEDQSKAVESKADKGQSSQWYNGCTFSCRQCESKFYDSRAFRDHVVIDHFKPDIELNTDDAITASEIIKCKVCEVEVRLDYMDVSTHLWDKHKIFIQDYPALKVID